MPLKTYTVRISGMEREDGLAPSTWVVYAESEGAAVRKAKECHVDILEEPLGVMRLEKVFEGLPPVNCGYQWTDCRYR